MSAYLRGSWLTASLWGVTALCATVAVRGWREAMSASPVRPIVPSANVASPKLIPADSLRDAASTIAAKDLFRFDRHPSTVSFRTDLQGIAPPPPPPKPPHPALALSGIVGGPPWEALVDGIPGKDGAVLVRKGDVLGDLKIRSIGRDSLVIQGTDTTWRLGVKKPWQ